ncbi:MAG: ABC transporter ATP-binding protein [Chloroflexota bacterium]|nr:MAG: ABC transporter ATP-binding protein [Chloroflexota bacterium]
MLAEKRFDSHQGCADTRDLLEVEGLTKAFGGLMAVDGLSFHVKKGEIFGMIGPNGSGKTVTFECLSGFYRPTKGKIWFKGKRIDGLKPHQILGLGLARTFQALELLPDFTVFDSLVLAALHALPLHRAREKASELLEYLLLSPIRDHLITEITPPDQRILELGKVMACQADTVLLDEVMAGLTDVEARRVLSAVTSLRAQGVTFIVVEHNMEMLSQLCDRVMALHFGRQIAEGTPCDILRHKDVVEAYLGEEPSDA